MAEWRTKEMCEMMDEQMTETRETREETSGGVMDRRVYTTISGHDIEYPEPPPEVSAFLARVRAMLEDPRVTEDQMIAVVYGRENPIMDKTIFPARGAVTRDVLANPVYHVMADMVFRKGLAERGETPEQVGARFTMSVTEAAERLGIGETALRRAIAAQRIPSWVRRAPGGRPAYYLDPDTLELLGDVGRRGPLPAGVEPLEVRTGYDGKQKVKLQIKAPEAEMGKLVASSRDARGAEGAGMRSEGELSRWRRVGVLTGGRGSLRFFVIEPADEDNEIVWHDFYVRGKFKIVSKENNTERARRAFEEFRAV